MKQEPFTCPRCGGIVNVVEDTYGSIDWGPAVIGADGTVRPQYPDPADGYQTVTYDGGITVRRACCTNGECDHQWLLTQPFDPTQSKLLARKEEGS